MEINLNTSGFGLSYTLNTNWATVPEGLILVEDVPNQSSAKDRIQEHLNAIKEVFFSEEYDDKTMGYIVEDHIIAIQDILDADGF
jgi:hypothetical protein